MYPPFGQYVVYRLFGLITIRWYAVMILGGAILAAWFAARRAAARGHNPEHVWNILAVGLLAAIAFARAWYVVFEWPRYRNAPWLYIINPANGGIAIHGGLLGGLLALWVYTRLNRLNFLEWADIGAPAVPIGQAIGRWGNFFNQEAYGRPTTLPWGLRIDQDHRIPPYDKAPYGPETRFHPTFLYESLWNVGVLIALLVVERRFRGRLLRGDLAMLYGIFYSIGRFFTEGLRTDSLCTNGVGGSCAGALRTAQVISLVAIISLSAIIAVRHLLRRNRPREMPAGA